MYTDGPAIFSPFLLSRSHARRWPAWPLAGGPWPVAPWRVAGGGARPGPTNEGPSTSVTKFSAATATMAEVPCTRTMGCSCPLCDMSTIAMASLPADAPPSSKAPPKAPARPDGWQERDAYGIPDQPAEEEADGAAAGGRAPYMLVAHPRPEILGMVYCAIEKYLRTNRGWRRRYSRDGKTEAWLGAEPWDLLLGGNKAKRVPFNRLNGDHRAGSG